MKLLFARQLSFFIVTVYVPCSMTVSVSWMSFWLDHKAVPARVALGLFYTVILCRVKSFHIIYALAVIINSFLGEPNDSLDPRLTLPILDLTNYCQS